MIKKILLAILVTTMVLGTATAGQAITASDSAVVVVETTHAWIWGYQDTQIPEYLVENFDRIFVRLGRFFEANVDNERILIFVVDFKTLQKLYHKHRGNPKIVAAFYSANSNRIYFTPRYINERYITHELINYFFDEYRERAVPALAEFLVWQGLIEKSIVKEFIIKEKVSHEVLTERNINTEVERDEENHQTL